MKVKTGTLLKPYLSNKNRSNTIVLNIVNRIIFGVIFIVTMETSKCLFVEKF